MVAAMILAHDDQPANRDGILAQHLSKSVALADDWVRFHRTPSASLSAMALVFVLSLQHRTNQARNLRARHQTGRQRVVYRLRERDRRAIWCDRVHAVPAKTFDEIGGAKRFFSTAVTISQDLVA